MTAALVEPAPVRRDHPRRSPARPTARRGRPLTAASATDGWLSSASSTSLGIDVQAAGDRSFSLVRPRITRCLDDRVHGPRCCRRCGTSRPGVKAALGRRRVVPVAREDLRPAELDLAVLAWIRQASRGPDPGQHAGQRHPDGVPAGIGDRVGDVQPALRRAVPDQRQPPEHGRQPLGQRRAQRSRTGADTAMVGAGPAASASASAGRANPSAPGRWWARRTARWPGHRRPPAPGRPPRTSTGCARCRRRSARCATRPGRAGGTAAARAPARHRECHLARPPWRRGDRDRQLAVGQRHPLGPAGRARGVRKQRGIVRPGHDPGGRPGRSGQLPDVHRHQRRGPAVSGSQAARPAWPMRSSGSAKASTAPESATRCPSSAAV